MATDQRIIVPTALASDPYAQYYSRVPFNIERPNAPVITREVTIASTGSQAATDAETELATDGTRVIIPDEAGDIGNIFLGGVTDGEIVAGHDVLMGQVLLGRESDLTDTATNRFKIGGGRPARFRFHPNCTDITIDGVTIDNGQGKATSFRLGEAFLAQTTGTNRVGVFNSMIRMQVSDGNDGVGWTGQNSQNVMFANNNIITAGNDASWFARLEGDSNWAVIDNTIRVSFHKLMRFSNTAVSNVFVDGGVWMREEEPTNDNNDAWGQQDAAGVDGIIIQNLDCYLQEPNTTTSTWMRSDNPSGTWVMRNINWFVDSSSVLSDSIINTKEASSASGADYGGSSGTHTYTYGTVTLPTDEWRDLSAYIPVSDPDALPDP